jgi:hypothetical protein
MAQFVNRGLSVLLGVVYIGTPSDSEIKSKGATLAFLGGEIGVSSKEGEGSTFGFYFTVRRCPDIDNAKEDTLRSSLSVLIATSSTCFIGGSLEKFAMDVSLLMSAKLSEAAIRDNSPSIDRRMSNIDKFSPKQEPKTATSSTCFIGGSLEKFAMDVSLLMSGILLSSSRT